MKKETNKLSQNPRRTQQDRTGQTYVSKSPRACEVEAGYNVCKDKQAIRLAEHSARRIKTCKQ